MVFVYLFICFLGLSSFVVFDCFLNATRIQLELGIIHQQFPMHIQYYIEFYFHDAQYLDV